jgi:hypothetical protein
MTDKKGPKPPLRTPASGTPVDNVPVEPPPGNLSQ